MEKHIKLVMGLVSGLGLMILNSELARSSIASFMQIFDPTLDNPVMSFILTNSLRVVNILSFLGVIIIIACSFLIIKKYLLSKDI